MWKKARQNKNGEYDDEEIEKQAAKIVMFLIMHLATVDYFDIVPSHILVCYTGRDNETGGRWKFIC